MSTGATEKHNIEVYEMYDAIEILQPQCICILSTFSSVTHVLFTCTISVLGNLPLKLWLLGDSKHDTVRCVKVMGVTPNKGSLGN